MYALMVTHERVLYLEDESYILKLNLELDLNRWIYNIRTEGTLEAELKVEKKGSRDSFVETPEATE